MDENSIDSPPIKYEYLDHTADVQLHAWGDSLKEAFEQCGMAMFGYMTELDSVEIKDNIEIIAEDPFMICKKIKITEFIMEGEQYKIKCTCWGEEFQIGKHPQGTEVKAITYSAMQIINEPSKNNFEVFVIIDI